MKNTGSRGKTNLPARRAPVLSIAAALTIWALMSGIAAKAQSTALPKETVKDGYSIQQSYDLGGHVVSHSGSSAMYDTLVNLQTGPRILNQTLQMRSVAGAKHALFDTLFTANSGYGGDPYNTTIFRMSKGKLYDFRGFFRRDRQYFDYNLLDNPLVPAGLVSNGYTFPQVLDSPHLFNTVRRMTDTTLTLFPISKISLQAGYSQNINQGPTYSSVHYGIEGLLFQNWRNSTDSWTGAVDWKPFSKTTLTYQEVVTHYKGDSSWQLTGLALQLANGAPVSLGFDNTTVPGCTGGPAVSNSSSAPPTANPTCNGYLRYNRSEPVRTIFPTEEFRLQSSDIKNLQINGRITYTGANSDLAIYNEYFNGLETRTHLRAATTSGNARTQRVDVTADFGIVWQISQKVALSDQFDFWDFRQPGTNFLSEVDQTGSSMLATPGAAGAPTITTHNNFLGQKTETNTILANWQASPRATLSIGYRYRYRLIAVTNPDGPYTVPIHESGGIFGAALRPTPQWKINFNLEASYADNAYTQISPRQMENYQLRTTYKPKSWMTVSGTFFDLERRDNVLYVQHFDHSRSGSAAALITPNEHYGLDLSYGFMDIFTQTDECYTTTPAPAGAQTASPACVANGTPYLANGYYDAPTQYGSIGIMLALVKKLQASLGYRMSAVNGIATAINARQAPGSLQSQYQSPYGSAAWTVAPGWAYRAEWNYYGYGEGSPIGPTSPRSFRGNVYTLSMHYEF